MDRSEIVLLDRCHGTVDKLRGDGEGVWLCEAGMDELRDCVVVDV